jgi:hypothetical protein
MNNIMVITHLDKSALCYDQWRKIFDANTKALSGFLSNTLVDKVDDNTAIIRAEVTDYAAMIRFMESKGPQVKKLNIQYEVQSLPRVCGQALRTGLTD